MTTRTSSTSAASTSVLQDRRPSSVRPAVALDRVTKRYAGENGMLALDGISLAVRPGEFVTLVGASGCGKSTLLNLVSGLDQSTSGSVEVDGHAAFMFQEHALFPWLSALDNVATPFRLKGVGRKDREAQARGYLEAVHLADFADRRRAGRGDHCSPAPRGGPTWRWTSKPATSRSDVTLTARPGGRARSGGSTPWI